MGRIWIALRDGEYTLGYWVHPQYQQQGVMSWAVPRILAMASDMGVQKVCAKCHVWNTASHAILKRYLESIEERDGYFIFAKRLP